MDFAFVSPVTVLGHRHDRLQPKVSSLSTRRLIISRPHVSIRQPWVASASDEVDMSAIDRAETDPAIRSGQQMRDELNRMSKERQDLQKRTADTLQTLTKQISDLMAQVREQTGMPPIADLPANDTPEDSPPLARPEPVQSSSPSVSSTEDSSSSSDEPYMDPKNFGLESTPGWQVLAQSLQLPDTEGKIEFRIQCTMDGCSIIEVDQEDPGHAGVRRKFIQSGQSFRVGYDPEAPKGFCGMLGSEQWAVALSHEEIRHFKRLCLALQKKMDRIGSGDDEAPLKKATLRRSADGMYNIRTAKVGLDCSIEMESRLVWVQAIGQPVVGQYALRAILFEGRQTEAFWPPDSVRNLFAALSKIRVD